MSVMRPCRLALASAVHLRTLPFFCDIAKEGVKGTLLSQRETKVQVGFEREAWAVLPGLPFRAGQDPDCPSQGPVGEAGTVLTGQLTRLRGLRGFCMNAHTGVNSTHGSRSGRKGPCSDIG